MALKHSLLKAAYCKVPSAVNLDAVFLWYRRKLDFIANFQWPSNILTSTPLCCAHHHRVHKHYCRPRLMLSAKESLLTWSYKLEKKSFQLLWDNVEPHLRTSILSYYNIYNHYTFIQDKPLYFYFRYLLAVPCNDTTFTSIPDLTKTHLIMT